MLTYVTKRLGSLCLSLIVASLVIFACIEIVPGDPASFMLGINAQPDTIQALRVELGLDQSPAQRYLGWVGGLLGGDMGTSYTYRTPVSDIVSDRLQVSLPLALYALMLTVVVAFPVGILAAARRGSVTDITVMGATQLGVAIPNFWFAILMVILFAINLRWFSAGGFPGWDAGIFSAMKALTLPAIALALPQASILARVMRSSLLDTLSEDYMRTARAKGLTRRQVLWRHALRNAMIPVLTIIGLQFAFLLAGAIIIENVFFLPGLGRLVFQAITQRDLIVVESVVMLLVFAVILVNFLVDIAYAWVDPRIRVRS
ncbi:ABC transporter permease [Planktomarina temperata]|nr:ABC transporter permease [Planktomarina temperata]